MINEIFEGRSIILILDNGVDANGNPKTLKKTFKNFTEAATLEQLSEIGHALSSLYDKALVNISVDEDHLLA